MSPGIADTLENLAVLLLLVLGAGVLVKLRHSVRRRMAQRLRSVATRYLPDAALAEEELALGPMQRLARRFAALGDHMPLFDAAQRNKLALQLVRAGFRSRRSVSVLIGVKLVFGACTAGQVALGGSHLPVIGEHLLMRVMAMMAAFIVGMIIPEYALGWLSRRRQRTIAGNLPDALDLLVICTNAGNSLSVGVRRVAVEMRRICPPLADEFAETADELQLSGDTSTALRNMAERIALPSVRSLVSTLIQSQQYGTPITQALRTLSRAERAAHIMALEEKAAKLAPKITLPMMLFILPTVILIAAGPAILGLMEAFK